MPIAMPRTTRSRPTNRQPCQIDFATDGIEIESPFLRRGSSRSEYTVSAETTNVMTLKYSARLIWPRAGLKYLTGPFARRSAIQASTTNSSDATGAVPYVVSRLYWLACSSLAGGTRFGIDASLAGVQNSEAQQARNWATYSQVSWLAKPTTRFSGIDRYSTARTTSPVTMLILRSSRSATAPASGPKSRYGSSEVIQTPPTAMAPAVSWTFLPVSE